MTKPKSGKSAKAKAKAIVPNMPDHMRRMYRTDRNRPTMHGNRISHRQVIMNAESAASYSASIHPSNPTLFPWVSKIADAFEEYRFNHLRIEFIGYAATTTGGPIVMAIDVDANDAIPDTVAGVNTQTVSCQGSAWDKFHVALPGSSRRWRLVDFSSEVSTRNASAANLVSCGNWIAITDTTAPAATAIGFFVVDYEIELRHPTFSVPTTMGSGRINKVYVDGLYAATAPDIDPVLDHYDGTMTVTDDFTGELNDLQVSSQSMTQFIASYFSGFFTTGGATNLDSAVLPQSGACEAHELAYAQGRSDNSSTTTGTVAQIVPTLNAAARFINGAVDLFSLVTNNGAATNMDFTYQAWEGTNVGIGWHTSSTEWPALKRRFRYERFDAVVTVENLERLHVYLDAAKKHNRSAVITVRPRRPTDDVIVGIHKSGSFAFARVQLNAMAPAIDLQTSSQPHDTQLFHNAWTAGIVESPTGL